MNNLELICLMMAFGAAAVIVQVLVLLDIRNTMRDMDYTICGYLHDMVYSKRVMRRSEVVEPTTEM